MSVEVVTYSMLYKPPNWEQQMRVFKYILLSLSPGFYMDILAEAKRQRVSVPRLIRHAVEKYLVAMTAVRLARLPDPRLDPNSSLNQSFVSWTPAEQRFADEVLRIHFEEDR
jgi:hypothetical protein